MDMGDKSPNEMKVIERLSSLGQFKGFPIEFYSAIPFEKGSGAIHSRFVHIANRLRKYPEDVDKMYREYKLPENAELYKLIHRYPQLLFYVEDISILADTLDNDVFFQIMNSKSVYVFLSHLHASPELFVFFVQLSAEEGDKNAWEYIEQDFHRYIYESLDYMRCATGRDDDYTIKCWRKDKEKFNYPEIDFNVFVPHNCDLPDDIIDGYEFVKLKNSDGFRATAQSLRNDITEEWLTPGNRTYFTIKKSDINVIIGAIILSKNTVISAKLRGNWDVCESKSFFIVYKKWLEKYNLSDERDTEGAEEDLPFFS